MEHWKKTIEAGNRRFAEGDWVQARELYLQALAEAQVLFGRWADHDMAVAAFVISHHNLADLHLMLGHLEEAAENLCASHERMLQTLADTALAEGLRAAAMHHSRRTYLELLQFIAEHGAFPRTDRLLGAPQRHAWPHKPSPASPGRHYH
ncbi:MULTISPECIES: tetratricopeptide repeat protein [unclassified Pseudomonas]|uniref:tetratricopeptide repeat protein n=1 Tax=unclassified Pseudomonas TaxID=196821 RepID=UPI00244B8F12|nr:MULTISPECIES: tetratricopeptide repeat protein [unclassified Pseudomonas]MDG9923804.1 tetratricopeptide repeat protein [Pseudomonas sp. GD04045]MDH0035921.1 tetratricopeptide repeat protein [Pseudomonas sp. GD04019]